MQITPEQIQAIVSKIVETAKPQKVILFGSYANGTPNKDSDLDILVIKGIENDILNERIIIRSALSSFSVPMDILVYPQEYVDYWKDTPLAFVTKIIKKGKLVYEQNSRVS